jgi:hypothetical protein
VFSCFALPAWVEGQLAIGRGFEDKEFPPPRFRLQLMGAYGGSALEVAGRAGLSVNNENVDVR